MLQALIEPVLEALFSGLRMAPVLFGILVGVEYFNHFYSDQLKRFTRRSRWFMPLIAAGLCLIPGCSFGIFFATLFATGMVSLGTLLAALLATSDEALYVFIPLGHNPLPFLLVKFFLAMLAGFGVDLFLQQRSKWLSPARADEHEDFCCRHHHHSKNLGEMALHALKHTLRIFLIVVSTLALANIWIDGGGAIALKGLLDQSRSWQPALAALVGILPNCSSSVIIATLFVKGTITFGAAISGLCAASGEALLVLAAKGVPRKHLFTIIALVLGISACYGYLIDGLGLHL